MSREAIAVVGMGMIVVVVVVASVLMVVEVRVWQQMSCTCRGSGSGVQPRVHRSSSWRGSGRCARFAIAGALELYLESKWGCV